MTGMRNRVQEFLIARQDGAVTVDWVVLTAAIIGIGMLALKPIAFSAGNSANEVADYVANAPVGYGNY